MLASTAQALHERWPIAGNLVHIHQCLAGTDQGIVVHRHYKGRAGERPEWQKRVQYPVMCVDDIGLLARDDRSQG